ncbi:unnamed protein product [Aureobasidium uvarum]|uniref:Uncharacterized protein n=1 Tax=Aureobasidium uvarum TaxID=2773716 RepID=A0A9N8PQF2_9PEZI|nr:unnamed protein product [Aureobasidium uvarum]
MTITAATPTINIPASGAATTATASGNSSGPKRDWTGIGIGAGVGAAVPLLALIAVGIVLWRRHRRRAMHVSPSTSSFSHESASDAPTKEAFTTKPAYLKGCDTNSTRTYEMDAMGERIELPLKSPRELPGSEGERQRYQAYQPIPFNQSYRHG